MPHIKKLQRLGAILAVFVFVGPAVAVRAQEAPLETDVLISNRTYTAPATERAAQTLSTSGPVIISSGVTVTFEAGRQIHLLPGFHAAAGSNFHAQIGLSNPEAPCAPANLSVANITGGSATIIWTASTGNAGVAGYEIFVDGVVIGTTLATGYTLTGLDPSISHSVCVRAFDPAGNYSAGATIAINAGAITPNTAQTFYISGPPSTWSQAAQGIASSKSSDVAKQNANAVMADLVNYANNYNPSPLKVTSEVTYNSDIGLAHGWIYIYSHWEPVGPGGVLLSAPVGSDSIDSKQATNDSTLSTSGSTPSTNDSTPSTNDSTLSTSGSSLSASGSTQLINTKQKAIDTLDVPDAPQGVAGIGGAGNTMVLFQETSFGISWPGATPPSVTISPAAIQIIHIGDSVTFTSAATHAENELIKHDFEWMLPPPPNAQWVRNTPEYNNGAATVYPSGIVSAPPDSQFSKTAASTRTITFTPLKQGRYVFRFAAADNVAGFNYSPGVVVMVENTPPEQAVTFSTMTASVGGPNIAIAHTAWNPTSLPDYKIGICLREQREDSSGKPYQAWLDLYNQVPAAGNQSCATERPPPERPGRIRYRAYAWNQWMTEMGTVREYVLEVPNRPPTIEWAESPPASVEYGQSLVIKTHAQDADNNLVSIKITMDGNTDRFCDFTNGQSEILLSDAVLDSNPKLNAGTYAFAAVAYDSESAASPAISHTVTVTKATPVGTFSSRGIAEGTALTTAQLSAQFTNPNDGLNVNAASTITYVIQSGGNASCPNGTKINIGTILPVGAYTIRVTFAATQNFNEATKDAVFTVEHNPDEIKFPDGLTNAVKEALGLDPNAPAIDSPELLDVNIHTPTSENQ